MDVVGELSINEWNNVKKPQLRMMDIHISHWQLFDVRNKSEWARILQEQQNQEFSFVLKKERLVRLENKTIFW